MAAKKRFGRMIGIGLVLAGLLSAETASAQGPYVGVSRPSDVRELAFSVRGKVTEVIAKPGDRVEAGAMLIRLDDAVQRSTLSLSESQAADTTGVELARLEVAFRDEELAITRDSARQGGANEQDVREAVFAADRAKVQLVAAENDMAQRLLTVERERARLDELRIAAPIAGDIVQTHKLEGETVDELTTVITLVNIETLEIDFPVPPTVSRGLQVGDPATVVWEDIEADPVTDARVVLIPATGDPTVREVSVRIEVPNPDRLPSGLHARITLRPEDRGG
ncbi:MAG: efflux RND transporter periplasmic adaptor subunit [Planctomycetota bacterium]